MAGDDTAGRAVAKAIDFAFEKIAALGGPWGALAQGVVLVLKAIFQDNNTDFAKLLTRCVDEIKQSMEMLNNEDLLGDVQGLIRVFNDLQFITDDNPVTTELLGNFVTDSERVMALLETRLRGQNTLFSDPMWAYFDAPAYNLLVALRVSVMCMSKFKIERIIKEYRDALRINYLLVGEPICRELYWNDVYGGGVGFLDCPPGTRCFLTGRICLHLFRQGFIMEERDKATIICEAFLPGISPPLPGICVRTVSHNGPSLEALYSTQPLTTQCKTALEAKFYNDEVVKTVLLANEKIISGLAGSKISVREVIGSGDPISLRTQAYGEDQPPCRPLRHQLEILMTRRP